MRPETLPNFNRVKLFFLAGETRRGQPNVDWRMAYIYWLFNFIWLHHNMDNRYGGKARTGLY